MSNNSFAPSDCNAGQDVYPPGNGPQHMFIQVSQTAERTKPSKEVRSFVMKSARHKNHWSTTVKEGNRDDPEWARKERKKMIKKENRERKERLKKLSMPLSTSFIESCVGDPAPAKGDLKSPPSALSASTTSPSDGDSKSGLPKHGPKASSMPIVRHDPVQWTPSSTGHDGGHTAVEVAGEVASVPSHSVVPGILTCSLSPYVQINSQMRRLLELFLSNPPNLLPVDYHTSSAVIVKRWIGNSIASMTSAPFVYTVLTIATMLMPQSMTSLSNPKEEAQRCRSKATNAIGARLGQGDLAVDDINIASVFMLFALAESQIIPEEVTPAQVTSQQVHEQGLKAMILQRGGLFALRSNPLLQTMIFMHSVGRAVAKFDRPYVVLTDEFGQLAEATLPSAGPSPNAERIRTSYQPFIQDQSLWNVVSDAIDYVEILGSHYSNQASRANSIELQRGVNLLIYRLLDWSLHAKEQRLERNPMDMCLCLALLILLVLGASDARDNLVRAQSAALAARELYTVFVRCELKWDFTSRLCAWILAMGAMATYGNPAADEPRVFFRDRYKTALHRQGFLDLGTETPNLLERMQEGLWMPQLDTFVQQLWGEMQTEDEDAQSNVVKTDANSGALMGLEDTMRELTMDRFFKK